MRIKCLAQGHNILMPGFEPSTSVSRNQHSKQTTIMLLMGLSTCKQQSTNANKNIIHMSKPDHINRTMHGEDVHKISEETITLVDWTNHCTN